MEPYYQDELITLYHGDCRKIVPQLKGKFSLLLTDPPYGLGQTHATVMSRGKLAKPKDYGYFYWDQSRVPQWLLDQLIDKCYNSIIFGGNYYRLPPTNCWLVWDKRQTSNFADGELAWTNLKGAVRIKRHLWNGMIRQGGETRYHPTQKPLGIILWAMEKRSILTKGVLDPFCGSGTTLVACKLKGIRGTGIEIDKKYCDITIKRLRRVKCQLNL
jgi:DNA modification methylase